MGGYTIHLSDEENIVLSAATVRRLIATGSGDAALLYLALLQNRGGMDPQRLAATLHWSTERVTSAESTLLTAGLVSNRQGAPAQERADERPEYTREDVARQLEQDERFSQLTANVEQLLGKKLSTPDLNILLGLYDYLGLPCDVLFLLVNHCVERITSLYGSGRRPTLRQIEKEGYVWARMGLMDLESANRYLVQYAERRTLVGRYMQVLRLGDRRPSPTEERHLLSWAEMGFPAETVELAYDKTMVKCGQLRWNYLSKILSNWHTQGLHTPEQVRQERAQRPAAAQRPAGGDSAGENLARMREYLQKVKNQGGTAHGD